MEVFYQRLIALFTHQGPMYQGRFEICPSSIHTHALAHSPHQPEKRRLHFRCSAFPAATQLRLAPSLNPRISRIPSQALASRRSGLCLRPTASWPQFIHNFMLVHCFPTQFLCSCGYQFPTSPQSRLNFSPSLLPLIQICRSYSASLQCCILWCRCFHNGSGSQSSHALTALVSVASGQHYRSQHPAQPPTPTLGAQRRAE